MILINFSHPLTQAQQTQVESLLGRAIETIHDCACHLAHDRPCVEQIVEIVDHLGLSAEDWQTRPILINLPGYAPAACVLLAELHGRMGHFPPIVRWCPTGGSVAEFEAAETINLQAVRDEARAKRW